NQTINNTGDINPADDLTNTSTAGGDVSGTFADLQVKADVITTTELADNAVATANVAEGAITGAKINPMGATPGQVLKWDGTTWKPDTDIAGGGGLNISAGPGISITGTSPNITVNNTGDTNGADDVLITTGADGDLGGVFQNLQIKAGAVGTLELGAQAVTAAKLDQMGATDGQVLRWNQNIFSWQPATVNVSGDNWGTQTVVTAPTLSGTGVTGSALTIAQQGALGGQVLKWDVISASWKPGNDEVGTGGGTNNNYTAGPGISITGTAPNFVINNIGDGDANPSNEIQTLSIAGNQLSLSQGGGSVTLPTGNNYTAGAGINITGTAPNQTIVNVGDLSITNELQTISLAGNQLSLSQGGGSVTLPGGNNYSAGTGINFSGTAPNITINNGGDLSNTNEIQTISLAGNQLSLSQGGGSVTLPGGNSYTAGPGISITGTAPNFSINNTGDADNSPTNELQTLSLTGPVLTISGSNSSVDFSPLLGGAGNFWQLNTDDIFNLNTGSVVVGGAAPAPSQAKFQVMGNGPAEAALITQAGSEAALMVQHAGSGPAAFFTSQTGNALITAEGNVGIHTKSPTTRLHVEGEGLFRSNAALPQVGLENSGSGFARLSLKNQSSAGRWSVQGRTAGSSEFGIEYTAGAKSSKVLTAIPDSGIVLGSPAQTATLRAFTGNDGFFLENSNNSHSWEFLVTNTTATASGQLALYNDQFGFGIPAGTFAINGLYQPSDRRLKKDVSLLSAGVLDKLLRLQAVTYRYQSEQDNAPRSLGFMAQDVQPLFPELVNRTTSRDGKGDFLSLNYAGFGVLAVKAVQEQQAQIKTLQQEKDQLQQQLQSLEARLQKLEQLLIEKK
ncbi:MAG TPA: tail fiber domain-containing protein, partial [Saprospiraceae bacterium]|nr:tail fiber domain-containing protein [Saprospiraceae bacterium]